VSCGAAHVWLQGRTWQNVRRRSCSRGSAARARQSSRGVMRQMSWTARVRRAVRADSEGAMAAQRSSARGARGSLPPYRSPPACSVSADSRVAPRRTSASAAAPRAALPSSGRCSDCAAAALSPCVHADTHQPQCAHAPCTHCARMAPLSLHTSDIGTGVRHSQGSAWLQGAHTSSERQGCCSAEKSCAQVVGAMTDSRSCM
jgi:hypothetical protein